MQHGLWKFRKLKVSISQEKVDFAASTLWFRSLWNCLSTWCDCLSMAITSSFQLWFAHRLKRWTPEFPRFKMTYSMYKINSRKCSKFVLKFKAYITIRFLSSKFPCNWILLHASFPTLFCLLSYSIMVISHLPNSWYPHFVFPFGPWVLTHLFHHISLFWSFKI